MKPVGHLGGGRRPVAGALGIGTGPIPRDDLDPGVFPQPLRDGLGGPLGEQGHGLPALEVHQDRAIGVPFPQGEIVHPQHGRGGGRGDGLLAQQTQQGLPAHREAPALTEAHPSLAT